MAKIPFDIKFRPQIESGEYKVETRDGRPVRIICWNKLDDDYQLVALVCSYDDGVAEESMQEYTLCGEYHARNKGEITTSSKFDLFIITPKPELSEFEKALEVFLMNADSSEETFHEEVKKHAAELLELARKELTRQGNIVITIEEFKKCYIEAQETGRKVALKDLPRWKKADRDLDAGTIDFAVFHNNDGGDHEDWLSVEVTNRLYKGEYYIELSALEKLPKEDEK